MSRGLDRRVLVPALVVVAVGALVVAWPRSDAEAGTGVVAIGKASNPVPAMTYVVLSWRPGQVAGAVLVVLGLAAVAFCLGRRFGSESLGRGVVGVGVSLVVVGAAMLWAAPQATSADAVARTMRTPGLPTAYAGGAAWSAGQVAGLVVGALGLLVGAVGVGTAGVRKHARRV